MDTANETYPTFQFPASELSAFILTLDVFILSLKDGGLAKFTPDDVDAFYNWLIENNIRDVRKIHTPIIKPNGQGNG